MQHYLDHQFVQHLVQHYLDYQYFVVQHLDYQFVQHYPRLLHARGRLIISADMPTDQAYYLISGRAHAKSHPKPRSRMGKDFAAGDILLFGSESRGLPASILQESQARNLRLPMRSLVRSLNLASTVNTVAYEAVRQFGGLSLDE